MKKKRILIDLAMSILFLFIMGYHHTGAFLHEWMGIVLFILFVLHNLVNRKWYSSLPKGKYNFYRSARLFINLVLFIAFLSAMVSGILMSQYVFGFLNLKTTMLARRMHMLSTSWSYILMSIHLGMHWSMVTIHLKRTMRKYYILKFVIPFVNVICVLLGCYVFYQKQLWNEMFILVDFVFLDYQETLILFIVKQILLMSPFILIGYLLSKRWRGARKNE